MTSTGADDAPLDPSVTDVGEDAPDVAGVVEDLGDDLGSFIREQRERAKLSLRQLSRIAEVSNPYLSQIERGLRRPSAEILQAIAKALEISSETLYVRAGFLEERPDGGGVESAVARDPKLNEAQRATLMEMYRTFLALNAAAEPESTRRRNVVDRVIDSVSTGGLDDGDVARASMPEEDPSEA